MQSFKIKIKHNALGLFSFIAVLIVLFLNR